MRQGNGNCKSCVADHQSRIKDNLFSEHWSARSVLGNSNPHSERIAKEDDFKLHAFFAHRPGYIDSEGFSQPNRGCGDLYVDNQGHEWGHLPFDYGQLNDPVAHGHTCSRDHSI